MNLFTRPDHAFLDTFHDEADAFAFLAHTGILSLDPCCHCGTPRPIRQYSYLHPLTHVACVSTTCTGISSRSRPVLEQLNNDFLRLQTYAKAFGISTRIGLRSRLHAIFCFTQLPGLPRNTVARLTGLSAPYPHWRDFQIKHPQLASAVSSNLPTYITTHRVRNSRFNGT